MNLRKAHEVRAHIAAQLLGAMVSNPGFKPEFREGESHPEACSRMACEYAEALMAELAACEPRNWGAPR